MHCMVSDMTKQAPASKSIASDDDQPKALPSERISTGIAGLDIVLGEDWRTGKSGVHVPSSVLLAGKSGIGKTTLMLHMSASIKTEKFLYITSDQTVEQIHDIAERIGIPAEKIKHTAIEHTRERYKAIELMRKHDPKVVVIDSVDEIFDSPYFNGDFPANAIRVVTSLIEESRKYNRAIFLIARATKKEDFAWIQKITPALSTVMRLDLDKPNDLRPYARILACPDKNRFGDNSKVTKFDMTSNGLLLANPSTATKDNRKHQVVIRIPSSLHEKLKRETESRQAASPGITITQSDVIRTILFESLR